MKHPIPARGILLLVMLSLIAVASACSGKSRRPMRLSVLPAIPTTQASKLPGNEVPPTPREFRAAWVATVGNIDWPSKRGLSSEQQKKEIIQILDRAAEINLNVIVLQVRTTADALYESKLEPWSAFLTGTQGKSPGYDPLTFWIDEAHKRGIELHAWFNPYRTRYGGPAIEVSDTHISKTHPEVVKDYGVYGWMDPGEPVAQEHSFNVFMDVVDRYDVDGIHIDDYFYPYPERTNPKDPKDLSERPFPDDPSYQKYKDAGGKLERNDWRRDNIDRLIERIYKGIRQRKPHVQFGISPFGFPRPGLPGIEYVKGFDQHDKLYADTVKWFQNGWCDYFSPQLYWKTGAPNQPYLGLLNWWTHNNPKGRHLFPGLFISRIDESAASWVPDEILGQIMITRLTEGAGGHIHFSMIALNQNRKGVADLLRERLYNHPALVPTTPWLDNKPPAAPGNVTAQRAAAAVPPATRASADQSATSPTTNPTTNPFVPLATQPAPEAGLRAVQVSWQPRGDEKVWLWSIAYKQGDGWNYKLVPGDQTSTILNDDPTAGPATRVAVAAVDRRANESDRVIIDTGIQEDPAK